MTSPRIALVVLDTLRKDTFDDYFDWLPGRRYENAYSTSHWTIPAHGSLFTGQYPSEAGTTAKSQRLSYSNPVLAERLSSEGYATEMWTANDQLAIWDGWQRGFDRVLEDYCLHSGNPNVFDWKSYAAKTRGEGNRRYLRGVFNCLLSRHPTVPSIQEGYKMFRREAADGGAERVCRRLRENPHPNGDFLFINLMDAHAPYHHPNGDGFLNPLIGDAFADQIDDPDEIVAGYEQTASLLSNAYRDIFDQLRNSYDYIITVSDHGEMLGEHGIWNHGYGLYPELTHVPLVISGDGINGEYNGCVNLLDIHRTILSLAETEGSGRGQDLLDSPQPRRVLTQYHGFTDEHREQFDAKGVSPSVFSEKDSPLSGVADPDLGYCFETHEEGIVGSPNGEVEGAIEELRAGLSDYPGEDAAGRVTESTKRRLRDLGYA